MNKEENYSIEYNLFGLPFINNFVMPNINTQQVFQVINANLVNVMKNIFNPLTISNSETEPGELPTKQFNSFISDLSSNKLSILNTPVETIFISLAKVSWNNKLQDFKTLQVLKICKKVSLGPDPEPLENQESIRQHKLEEQNLNFDRISDTYIKLFEIISVTN